MKSPAGTWTCGTEVQGKKCIEAVTELCLAKIRAEAPLQLTQCWLTPCACSQQKGMSYISLKNERSLIYTHKTILLWSSPGQTVVLCTYSAPRGLGGCPHPAHTLYSRGTPGVCLLPRSNRLHSHIWFPFDFGVFFIMIVCNMAFHWVSSCPVWELPMELRVRRCRLVQTLQGLSQEKASFIFSEASFRRQGLLCIAV